MTVFTYQATDRRGKIIKGKVEAAEKREVIKNLQKQNLLPIRIEQEGKGFVKFQGISFSNPFEEANQKDLLLFTQQLTALLKAGIPLDQSLNILTELTEKDKFRDIIETVKKNVNSGSSFSDALAKYPKLFTKIYISMIKAGETGGVLDVVLSRLYDFLDRTQKLKENVQTAMVYPAILVLVGGSAVMVLMVFVIPKFTLIFSDMGQEIPTPTAILIGISSFITKFWWAILFLSIIFSYMGKMYVSTPEGKLKWDNFKLDIPLIGGLIRKIEVSRFCRTLGTLIKSEVSILQSLSIVKDVISNEVISRSLENIHKGVKVGKGVSGPLKESNAMPPLAIHMISIGEETGNLEDMLFKVADIYDNEIEVSIKKLISLIEPAMILFMAAVVGFIVVSLLIAIFSINEIPF